MRLVGKFQSASIYLCYNYFMPGSENLTAAEQRIIILSNFYYRDETQS